MRSQVFLLLFVCYNVCSVWAASTVVLSEDFDPDIDNNNWLVIEGGQADTLCDSVSGNSFRFNGQSSGQRQLVTIPLDVSEGGLITFSMRYGQNTLANCDPPDTALEQVQIEYSLDNGKTWANFKPFALLQFEVFSQTAVAVPRNAQTVATIFRWIQPVFDGSNDNWAIDNIVITATRPDDFICCFMEEKFDFCDKVDYKVACAVTDLDKACSADNVKTCYSTWQVEDDVAATLYDKTVEHIFDDACRRRAKALLCGKFIKRCGGTDTPENGGLRMCSNQCEEAYHTCYPKLEDDFIKFACSNSSEQYVEYKGDLTCPDTDPPQEDCKLPPCTYYRVDDVTRFPVWLKITMSYVFAFMIMVYCGVNWDRWWEDRKKQLRSFIRISKT